MAFKDLLNSVKSEAGDAVEVTKLKTKISKEKSTVKDDYEKIGELIYNRYANSDCDDAEVAPIVNEIKEARARIKELNADIEKIRMND